MAIVWTTNGRRGVVGLLVPWLSSLTLRLFTDPSTLSPQLTTSDFVEATFSGYAPVVLGAWSGNFLNGNDQGEVDEAIHEFRVSSVGPLELVYGYFVTDQHGYTIFAELHPAGPVEMELPGQRFSVKPRVMCGELC